MEYIGDGTLLAVLEKQNIQSLSEYGFPSFFTLSTDLNLSTVTQSGICRHETSSLAYYGSKILMHDFLAHGCFIRHAETTCKLTFHLYLPPYCRMYRYNGIKYARQALTAFLLCIPTGTPTPDGFCTMKEKRLFITVIGEGVLGDNGKEIFLNPGKSALLFGTDPDMLEKCISMLEAPTLYNSKLYQQAISRYQMHLDIPAKTMSDTLISLTSCCGGILSGHGEYYTFLSDTPLVGQAFLYMGDIDRATKTALFLLSRLEMHGYLPLYMSPNDPKVVCEETGMERMLYPAVCHFFLDLIKQDILAPLAQSLQDAVLHLFTKIGTAMHPGSLGFAGNEFPLRRGLIPRNRLFYANALATAEYLHLAKRLGKSENISEEAILRYRTDFDASNPKIDSPHRLGRMRLPQRVYGACPACGEFPYVGWLSRYGFGAYLCPSCMEKGIKEYSGNLASEPLPGAFAAAAWHLFTAGVKNETEFHRDVENCLRFVTDNTSFYDLAMLGAVLSRIDPARNTLIKDQLDERIKSASTPFFAAEAAIYLLASKKSETL